MFHKICILFCLSWWIVIISNKIVDLCRSLTHILAGCCTGTWEIACLSRCQWVKQSWRIWINRSLIMMTSSKGNIFRVTGPLCREFTGHRSIPLSKASEAELWCFHWSTPEQTVEKTIETPVTWDAIAPIMTSHCSEDEGNPLRVAHIAMMQASQPLVWGAFQKRVWALKSKSS